MRKQKKQRSNFFIRLAHWEYWPFGIVQFPLFFYVGWLSIRARSLTFFSAANPGIVMGGMFGESKYEVLKKIPSGLVPKTLLMSQPTSLKDVVTQIQNAGLSFPLILKPDVGERGFMVQRVDSTQDIQEYLNRMKFDFLVQEHVAAPIELGVFYIRHPHEPHGSVTSVVGKEMLTLEGDGISTVRELIFQNERAKLQWKKLKVKHADKLDHVLAKGERFELISIGNHCLGTKFINRNDLINPQLSETFDRISKQIHGFYFGRFDLRCASFEDLYKGKVLILELNGCGAEPGHIYHPGYSMYQAIKELFLHWKNIFLIARANAKLGYPYTPFKQALSHYKHFKTTTRSA